MTGEDSWPDTVRDTVIVGERELLIDRPDERQTYAGFRPDGSVPYEEMPYWSEVWPAARMLAKAVLRQTWPADQRALEVGCGLGLPGVAALAQGFHVTFSDFQPLALRYAARNALLNGFDQFATRRIDWRQPPDDLHVHLVLGSDLLYELDNIEPLLGLVRRVLLPDGQFLLTDMERVPAFALREALAAHGLAFATETMRAGQPGGRRVKGTLYRITHAAPA